MGEQHFLTLCIGFQRTIRTYNQLSLNTAIKAYQNNHDKFVIMLEVRKTFQNLIWIWEFMQPWWCIKSNAKIKHHFTPWNLSFILNLDTLAIKYKKYLQNYYMQKYPLSDIPALAVNTLHILEINKKHEWKDTTSDPMCPYASFLLNHRKPEKLSRSLPRHKRAVFSLILLPPPSPLSPKNYQKSLNKQEMFCKCILDLCGKILAARGYRGGFSEKLL